MPVARYPVPATEALRTTWYSYRVPTATPLST